MKPEIFERIFASPLDTIIKELKSIPALGNCLYRVNKQDGPLYNGFIVAKNSEIEIQGIDKYCGVQFAGLLEQIALPAGVDSSNLNLKKYLKLLAIRESAITIYYKRKVFGNSHIWEIEAMIFDYHGDQANDYVVSEHIEQGSTTFGTYTENTNYSRVTCEVVNGFKGTAKMPPFEMPLLSLIRSYEFYDWPHIAIV
jgi:hypothetical protein